ncbi:hypothetical protein KR215_012118, partial [Drosophila sulfurigaster]
SSVERGLFPLHKDKKWVQEQSQVIAEYLDEMMQTHEMPGFTKDYFSRGAISLRQMTMKQFVNIVKFFFHFIFGNRVNVGNNHVEDITNALHKIKYPFQVNKSWLVTPTTPSSFGHVIVMFDFLKDLAPSPRDDEYEEFPFMETCNLHDSSTDRSVSHLSHANATVNNIVLSEETNHLLFVSASQSFGVWDTQNWNEYEALKSQASERIIKCLTDLNDGDALDADLVRQRNERKQLDEQLLQRSGDNKREQLLQLRAQEQQLLQELQAIRNNTQEHTDKMAQLRMFRKESAERIDAQRKELQKLQRRVDTQRYTAEQLKSLRMMLSDLENEQRFYSRQIQEFTDRGYNQQVQLSRAKKQLVDKVGKFNTYAQNISLDSNVCSASENDQMKLELPFPPQQADIVACSKRLTQLATLLGQRREQCAERCRQLEKINAKVLHSNGKLEFELNKLNSLIQAYDQQCIRLAETHKTKMLMLAQHQQQLIERKLELNSQLEQQRKVNDELEHQVLAKRQANEEFLCAAEQRQRERLNAQEIFIKEQNAMLAEAEAKLEVVKAKVAENAGILSNLEQELDGIQPLSLLKELIDKH